MSLGLEARRHLRAQRHGVLSTLSRALEGYPFGSVVPYVLDQQAVPVILVSRLAEHTKNISADPRVSLLVHEPGADVQAGARVTLMGQVHRVENPHGIKERYVRFFPAARDYHDKLDFDYYRIEPATLRVVAGFGKIHWISREAYAPPANALAAQENGIIAQMNQDHARNLDDCCRHYHQRRPEKAELIGIDCDGFDVRADSELLRFDFDPPVTDAAQARAALVAMADQSRAA
jgi:putative heme iron utilization protein